MRPRREPSNLERRVAVPVARERDLPDGHLSAGLDRDVDVQVLASHGRARQRDLDVAPPSGWRYRAGEADDGPGGAGLGDGDAHGGLARAIGSPQVHHDVRRAGQPSSPADAPGSGPSPPPTPRTPPGAGPPSAGSQPSSHWTASFTPISTQGCRSTWYRRPSEKRASGNRQRNTGRRRARGKM